MVSQKLTITVPEWIVKDLELELSGNKSARIQELMGYEDIGTVLVYANRKRIREQIPNYYNKNMSALGKKLDSLVEGQETLASY